MRRVIAATLLVFATKLSASPYIPLIDAAAARHGVDPIVLRTIAEQESNKYPWVANVDGESLRFPDKPSAVRTLWMISRAPWMVKSVDFKGRSHRRFFRTQQAASVYVTQLARSTALKRRHDSAKGLERGEFRVRQLHLVNTDLGIAQINYRWHGKGVASVEKWLDPAFNLDYAASHLAALKRKHGTDLAAAGFYRSGNSKPRRAYMANFLPRYEKELRHARVSLAVAP